MADFNIDFTRALHRLVQRRRLIILLTGIMAALGVFVALNSPKSYSSSVVLAPELSNSNRMSEGLGSLTAMIGIDLNSMNSKNVDAIFPEIYPKVVTSPDFIVELWNCPVTTCDSIQTSYFNHVANDGFTPLWGYPAKWLSSDDDEDTFPVGSLTPDARYLTRRQESICNRMILNIMCDVAKENGLITITVTDEDPCVASAIADTVQRKLQSYITDYRTQKARLDYAYTERLVEEARQEYLEAQRAASRFADANISAFKQSVLNEREVLQSEFQLKYNTYTALSQQLQSAKALIQAATPVYTVISRAAVPNRASSTPRSLLVIIYALVGFVSAVVWILFGSDFFRQLIRQYRQLDDSSNA